MPRIPLKDTIKRMVQARAQKRNIRFSSEHWKKTKGLKGIYDALLRNKFFGYPGWPEYLEKEIGYKREKR